MNRVTLLSGLLSIFVIFAAGCSGGSGDNGAASRPEPSSTIEVRARDVKFDHKALAVPANEAITVHFVNDDQGVLHNLAIYTDKNAKEKLFAGELIAGKKTIDYTFTAPSAGVYYFRCDTHPDMNGTFYVEAPAAQASEPPF